MYTGVKCVHGCRASEASPSTSRRSRDALVTLKAVKKLRIFCLKACSHNTTGPQCNECAEGFFGDATGGSEDDCRSCPCPLPENK